MLWQHNKFTLFRYYSKLKYLLKDRELLIPPSMISFIIKLLIWIVNQLYPCCKLFVTWCLGFEVLEKERIEGKDVFSVRAVRIGNALWSNQATSKNSWNQNDRTAAFSQCGLTIRVSLSVSIFLSPNKKKISQHLSLLEISNTYMAFSYENDI